MGKHCMVLFCTSKGNRHGLYYFSLTRKRYVPWMRAIGRDPTIEKLSCSNLICSEHFSDDSFLYIKGKRCLKKEAIPTFKLGPRKPLLVLNYQVLRSEEGIASVSRKIECQGILPDDNLWENSSENSEHHSIKELPSSFGAVSSEKRAHLTEVSKNLEKMQKSNKILSKKLKNANERMYRLTRKVTHLRQIVCDLRNGRTNDIL